MDRRPFVVRRPGAVLVFLLSRLELLLGQLVPVSTLPRRLDFSDGEGTDGPGDLVGADRADLDEMPDDAVAPVGVYDLLDELAGSGDADRPLGIDLVVVRIGIRLGLRVRCVLVCVGGGGPPAEGFRFGRGRGEYARDDEFEIPRAAVSRRV